MDLSRQARTGSFTFDFDLEALVAAYPDKMGEPGPNPTEDADAAAWLILELARRPDTQDPRESQLPDLGELTLTVQSISVPAEDEGGDWWQAVVTGPARILKQLEPAVRDWLDTL